MKLVTQDGRELEISREHHLTAWSYSAKHPRCVVVTVDGAAEKVDSVIRYYSDGQWHEIPSFYWNRDRVLEAAVGEYATGTSRHKAAQMLQDAWQSGAPEFTMPQDTFAKSAAEELEDLAEAHGLILVSINELGYTPIDTARNLRIWRETSEFERRNIIVADEYGSYETSLAKWRALQRQSA